MSDAPKGALEFFSTNTTPYLYCSHLHLHLRHRLCVLFSLEKQCSDSSASDVQLRPSGRCDIVNALESAITEFTHQIT